MALNAQRGDPPPPRPLLANNPTASSRPNRNLDSQASIGNQTNFGSSEERTAAAIRYTARLEGSLGVVVVQRVGSERRFDDR
jgi:hypothetical protein